MKNIMILRADSIFPLLLRFSMFTLILLFTISCQKGKEELEQQQTSPSITKDNLQTAYAKEMNRVKMYKLFNARAEKEKMKQVAKLYRALARSEEIHAKKHAEFLQKLGIQLSQPAEENVTVGTTLQTLKMALSMEDLEYGSMYPNLIRTADAEKYDEATKHFADIQDADGKHAELIRYAISQSGKIPPTKYYICPHCGYIVESKNVPECPTCKTKIADFEVIS